MTESNRRELETDIKTNLENRLTYGGYLDLGKLLNAQQPLSTPAHHDEMLFIIQHQTSELWMKLIIHELSAAIAYLQADNISPCMKILARVKQIQRQLFEQWSVLETLTPSEYGEFRHVLSNASGFQSFQYRQLEFMLGNKNADYLAVFTYDDAIYKTLQKQLSSPSLYDEFLRYLYRHRHSVPNEIVERDWTQAYQRHQEVIAVFKRIYENRNEFWECYELAEKLVDVEESFQLWRYRHMKTVERVIGYKKGTGGSSGVSFLKKALDLTFFPELLDVRTEINA